MKIVLIYSFALLFSFQIYVALINKDGQALQRSLQGLVDRTNHLCNYPDTPKPACLIALANTEMTLHHHLNYSRVNQRFITPVFVDLDKVWESVQEQHVNPSKITHSVE